MVSLQLYNNIYSIPWTRFGIQRFAYFIWKLQAFWGRDLACFKVTDACTAPFSHSWHDMQTGVEQNRCPLCVCLRARRERRGTAIVGWREPSSEHVKRGVMPRKRYFNSAVTVESAFLLHRMLKMELIWYVLSVTSYHRGFYKIQ